MRSETPSMITTFILALGIMLWVAVVTTLATGKINLIGRSHVIDREEKPEAFWATLAIMAVIGTIAIGYGAVHFGPGG